MPITRLRAVAAFALALTMLAGSLLATSLIARASQASPEEMLASLDGLESAYARRYGIPPDWIAGVGTPTPVAVASATDRDPSMTRATVTILQFATEEDAANAWTLTSGSLVAGAIIGQTATDLTGTPLPGLGDASMLYLLADPPAEGEGTAGILFVRDGTTGIIVEGDGETTNAALGERLQAFAQRILDREPTTPTVTVIAEGEATGGAFDRMPGRDDADILGALLPLWDYDLTVNDRPILPPTGTPAVPCG